MYSEPYDPTEDDAILAFEADPVGEFNALAAQVQQQSAAIERNLARVANLTRQTVTPAAKAAPCVNVASLASDMGTGVNFSADAVKLAAIAGGARPTSAPAGRSINFAANHAGADELNAEILLTAAELAQKTGTTPDNPLFLKALGKIPKPQDNGNGAMRYSEGDFIAVVNAMRKDASNGRTPGIGVQPVQPSQEVGFIANDLGMTFSADDLRLAELVRR